jgi:hypothetical protein
MTRQSPPASPSQAVIKPVVRTRPTEAETGMRTEAFLVTQHDFEVIDDQRTFSPSLRHALLRKP